MAELRTQSGVYPVREQGFCSGGDYVNKEVGYIFGGSR
jgi:hypothetical protein